jgi:hypothetical protein
VYPEQTGFSRNLYSLRGFPDELSQQVERNLLGPVDSDAAKVLNKLCSGIGKSQLKDRDVYSWSRFIVSLLLRMPEDIALLKSRWFAKLGQISDEIRAGEKLDSDTNGHDQFFHQVANPPPDEVDEDVFNIFISIISEGKSIDLFGNMHWSVLNYSAFELELYLSDRPIVRLSPLGAVNGMLILPLGPKHLFVAANNQAEINALTHKVSLSHMKDANRLIVSQSNRYAYSTSDSCLRFMDNHFARFVEPRSAGAI